VTYISREAKKSTVVRVGGGAYVTKRRLTPGLKANGAENAWESACVRMRELVCVCGHKPVEGCERGPVGGDARWMGGGR
jgi:hypothetical protein